MSPTADPTAPKDSQFDAPEMRIDLDVEGMKLSDAETATVEAEVDRIKPLTAEFPVQILHVNLRYNRNSEEYEVKLALVLTGQTFATADVSESWHGSLENCVRKMIRRVEHYKQDLSNVESRSRAVNSEAHVEPTRQIDAVAVRTALSENDYAAFRREMGPFDASLRDRIGRWVQMYPQVDAMVGERLTLADIVEEVFLMAYEQFDSWHPEMLFGQWLETLIDPAVKAIARDPDGELEAISFQKTWQDK